LNFEDEKFPGKLIFEGKILGSKEFNSKNEYRKNIIGKRKCLEMRNFLEN
jgi:hypothetical protein